MNIFGTKNRNIKYIFTRTYVVNCKPIAFKQKIVVVKRVYEEVTYR